MKTDNFRGDLTDISAKKEALISAPVNETSRLHKMFTGNLRPKSILIYNENEQLPV